MCLKKLIIAATFLGNIFGMVATENAQAMLIDSFDLSQQLTTAILNTPLSSTIGTDGSFIGSQRTMTIEKTATTNGGAPFDAWINFWGGGTFAVSSPPSVDGVVDIWWQGIANADLSDGGTNNLIAISVLSADHSAGISLELNDGINTASWNFITGSVGGIGKTFFAPLTTFTGVDTTSINEIHLSFWTTEPATDINLDFMKTVATPEPATLGLLGVGMLALGCFRRKRK